MVRVPGTLAGWAAHSSPLWMHLPLRGHGEMPADTLGGVTRDTLSCHGGQRRGPAHILLQLSTPCTDTGTPSRTTAQARGTHERRSTRPCTRLSTGTCRQAEAAVTGWGRPCPPTATTGPSPLSQPQRWQAPCWTPTARKWQTARAGPPGQDAATAHRAARRAAFSTRQQEAAAGCPCGAATRHMVSTDATVRPQGSSLPTCGPGAPSSTATATSSPGR